MTRLSFLVRLEALASHEGDGVRKENPMFTGGCHERTVDHGFLLHSLSPCGRVGAQAPGILELGNLWMNSHNGRQCASRRPMVSHFLSAFWTGKTIGEAVTLGVNP